MSAPLIYAGVTGGLEPITADIGWEQRTSYLGHQLIADPHTEGFFPHYIQYCALTHTHTQHATLTSSLTWPSQSNAHAATLLLNRQNKEEQKMSEAWWHFTWAPCLCVCMLTFFLFYRKERFHVDKPEVHALVTKHMEHSWRKNAVVSSCLCSPQMTEPETDLVTSPEWLEIRNHSQVIWPRICSWKHFLKTQQLGTTTAWAVDREATIHAKPRICKTYETCIPALSIFKIWARFYLSSPQLRVMWEFICTWISGWTEPAAEVKHKIQKIQLLTRGQNLHGAVIFFFLRKNTQVEACISFPDSE